MKREKSPSRPHRPTARPRSRGASLVRLATGLAIAAVPTVASASSEGGLVLTPDPGMMLALIALFVALVFPVNALVFKPLLRVLDERNERIEGTRRRAAKLEGDASELLARYERSVAETRDESERERRSALEEVRAEAQRETAAARREAESRIEQSRREVASALDGARETLRSQSAELARDAAAQVLGRAL